MKPMIYRCPQKCPRHKTCFILKTETAIKEPIVVLVKCAADNGKDIRVTIGGERPP